MSKGHGIRAWARPLATALAAAIIAAPAGAQSLKSMRAQEADEQALAREVAYTNTVCASSIASRIDWRASAGWPAGASLVDACDGALGAIEAMCRSDAGKARAQGIATFVCAGDGAGPSISGRTFRYGARPGVSGFRETRDYLGE